MILAAHSNCVAIQGIGWHFTLFGILEIHSAIRKPLEAHPENSSDSSALVLKFRGLSMEEHRHPGQRAINEILGLE
jgi:hypothetical protein